MSDPVFVTCTAAELRRFTTAVLLRIGVGAEDATFMADAIVDSDLAGHESHGMRRLPEYVQRWRDGKVAADVQPRVDIDTGAVARLDGGLALVAEALAGAFTGAGTVTANPEHDDQGVLVIALDVTRLRPLDDFATEVEQFINYVRDVPLEHGSPAIRMPGESGAATTRRRVVEGVPVQAFTWRALHALATELDVEPPAPIHTG